MQGNFFLILLLYTLIFKLCLLQTIRFMVVLTSILLLNNVSKKIEEWRRRLSPGDYSLLFMFLLSSQLEPYDCCPIHDFKLANIKPFS